MAGVCQLSALNPSLALGQSSKSRRELSQGESSASCPRGITGRAGDMSSSPYPAHVTPTPQLSHLLIHFPRAQSCQLLELAELHMQDVAQLPGAQPVLWPPLLAQSHRSPGSPCFGSALVNCAAKALLALSASTPARHGDLLEEAFLLVGTVYQSQG